MDYAEFAADLPLHNSISFSSAEENEEVMQQLGINQEVRQLGRGTFRSDLCALGTDHADFFCDRFNRSIAVNLEPPEGMMGLMICRSAGEPFLAAGHNVANDKMIIMPSGSGVDIVGPELCGSDSIGLSQAKFNDLLEALCPTFEPGSNDILGHNASDMEGDINELHAIRKGIVNLVAHPENDSNGEIAAQLVSRAVSWVGSGSGKSKPVYSVSKANRIRIAKQAQEYIHANHQLCVRTEDICRATSAGVRTVQRCFREFFGLTISEYLKSVRLNEALRHLRAACPGEASVTDIAMEHGLPHLGRFSVEFRQHFGVSPRQVLTTPKIHRSYSRAVSQAGA